MTWISLLCGSLVGFALGLTGGGGAIFAVPLLVYVVGLPGQVAVGTSLVTVGVTALVGFLQRWQAQLVELRTGLLFATAGVIGAPLGSWLSRRIPENLLLMAFSVLMLVIAARMWRQSQATDRILPVPATRADDEPGPTCYRDPQGILHLTSRCALLLASVGLVTGFLSGLFGVGGGFLIVPALITFSRMGIQRAIGTSLMVISLVSVSAVTSYLVSGSPLPLKTILLFATGSVAGLFAGAGLATWLSGPRLQRLFALAILLVASWVVLKNVW